MKKLITLVAVLILAMSTLTSCGNNEVPEKSEVKTMAVSLYGDPVSDTWILEIGNKETFANSEIVAIYVITESQYDTFYELCESKSYTEGFEYLNDYKYAILTGEEWSLLHSFFFTPLFFFI